MSAIADHSPSIPTGRSFCTSLVYGMGQSTLSALRAWQVRMRQRREIRCSTILNCANYRSPMRMSVVKPVSRSGREFA